MSNSEKYGMIYVCILLFALTGCAPIIAKPDAISVVVVTEKPNPNDCRLLGEVIGTQGNWFTGAYTSDKNLMIGARNDLRNATHEMGGNTVYIQNINNSGHYSSSGTVSSTVIGYAYKCK